MTFCCQHYSLIWLGQQTSFFIGTGIRQLHLQRKSEHVLHVYISTNKLKTKNTAQTVITKFLGA